MSEEKRDQSEHIFDPMARTSSFGIQHLPVGTLEELRENNLDPERVACCHRTVEGEVRGCPVWRDCQFQNKNRGGFKGQGPKNVGFYLRTTKDEGSRSMESFMPCYGFVLALQARMNFGRAQREEGKDHEVIRIIAQQGEPIVVRRYESVAADGGNRSGDIRIRSWPEEIKVPEFLRPNQNPGVTYEQQMREREERRMAIDEELENNRDDDMRRLLREGNEEIILDDDVLEVGGTAPAREPGNGARDADPAPPRAVPLGSEKDKEKAKT